MKIDSKTGEDVEMLLLRYTEDGLPNFAGRPVKDVNQVGIFGDSALHIACVRGDLSDVRILIEGGAAIDLQGEMGRAALHEAVAHGHEDVVRYLLGRGADRTIRDKFLMTPVDVAKRRNDSRMVSILVDA